MAVNSHRIGSGRNCSDPFTRLRNTRVPFHHVTQLLCGGDRGLWPRAHDYVLARIRSKCRCAKRECEKDAHASNRPAAQATWSACCFHTLIVMPDRISCKQRWLTAPNGSFRRTNWHPLVKAWFSRRETHEHKGDFKSGKQACHPAAF